MPGHNSLPMQTSFQALVYIFPVHFLTSFYFRNQMSPETSRFKYKASRCKLNLKNSHISMPTESAVIPLTSLHVETTRGSTHFIQDHWKHCVLVYKCLLNTHEHKDCGGLQQLDSQHGNNLFAYTVGEII